MLQQCADWIQDSARLTHPPLSRAAMVAQEEFPELPEVLHWMRQLLGIACGVVWGIVALEGWVAIAGFVALNAVVPHLYCTNFIQIAEDEWKPTELLQEGFASSFALFLVSRNEGAHRRTRRTSDDAARVSTALPPLLRLRRIACCQSGSVHSSPPRRRLIVSVIR